MVRISVIVAGILVYLSVMFLVVGSHATSGANDNAPPPTSADNARANELRHKELPFRSVAMQIQRTDWIDKYKQSIDKVADLGFDTVLLVVDARQENGSSSHIYLDLRTTPSVEQLGELIDKAKSRDLRVILMPIVLLDNPSNNTEWRGSIKPAEVDKWFDSYRSIMAHFAGIAADHNVDVLVIGSELVTMEEYTPQWLQTISLVRGIFKKGFITYSSNWDHYWKINFWDQLDMVCMNSYWTFAKDEDEHPSVEAIVKRWREIQGDLIKWLKDVKKPLMFTEVGWFSQANTAAEPWDYTQDKALDLDLQKRMYEGFFEAWVGDPQYNRYLGGFSIWEWPPGGGGAEDKGYTPEGKPAEQVLRDWLARPQWKVE